EPEPEPLPPPEPTPQEILAENLQNPVHYRIMFMGDSLMEDLGPATHRALRQRHGLSFILAAKFSTGLCRPDYFNWPENMENVVREGKPNLIVVFMGANDGMPIRWQGKVQHPVYGEPWRAAYREKMREVFDIAKRHGCEILWVGLPPMGGRYAHLLKQTEISQRTACSEHGIEYLDTIPIMGDENGEFRAYITDATGKTIRIRRKDKEHLSPDGNKLLVSHLLPRIEKRISLFRNKNPHKRLSDKEANAPAHARLDVAFKYSPKKRRRK
ncbi:MAG: DUF459 domain-containing protein, partial [Akkermansia sp.]|nr:DUF459 domain-containing protein [Akkermansia sp.]